MRDTSPRGARPRTALAAVAAAAFAFLSCGPQGGEPSASGAKAEWESDVASLTGAPKAEGPASLGELPGAVARLEQLREEVATAIVVDDAERRAEEELDAGLMRIGRLRDHLEGLPFDELVEVSRRLTAIGQSVSRTDAIVAARLRRVEEDSLQVDELKKTFGALADLAGQTDAPPAIRLRTGICRAQLDELAARLAQRRTGILVLVDKLAEARGSVAAMKADMGSRPVASSPRWPRSRSGI